MGAQAGGDSLAKGGLDARLVEEMRRGLPLGEELLRFFDANRYALLPLDDLASRLFRDVDLVRTAGSRLVELGFLRTEGTAPVFILTRDPAKLGELEVLLRVLAAPEGEPWKAPLQNGQNPS
jgi:hypothetical protein